MVRSTLFVFILAVLFAYLLSPLVNLLDRFLPSRTRTPALALAYMIFIGIVVFVGMQIGSTVASQAKAFEKDLPESDRRIREAQPQAAGSDQYPQGAVRRENPRATLRRVRTRLLSTVAQAGLKFITVASDLIFVVIIPILAFFFLKEARTIRQHILDLIDDGPRRDLLDDVMADVHLLLAHYMRALVVLSARGLHGLQHFLLDHGRAVRRAAGA